MVRAQRLLLLILPLLIGIIGCGPTRPSVRQSSPELEGRVMLWHSWEESEAAVLESLIATFEEIHPDVTVVVVRLEEDEILERYQSTAVLGLGPDLLIGPSTWIPTLREEGTIRDLKENEIEPDRYLAAALDLGLVDGRYFGLPITIDTPVLLYHPDQVDQLPETYEELLLQAQDGYSVALSTRADDAYLGIQAFGDSLFDPLADPIQLQADGFVAWMNWLTEARENPNVILSRDRQSLARLFAEGNVAYFIGTVEEIQRYSVEDLDAEAGDFGVALLPAGPFSLSRPLIEADLLYFNSASSSNQQVLALSLADFLTNEEQNNALLREADLVPANQRVRVNDRVYPEIYPFVQSGRASIALPEFLKPYIIGEAADTAYTSVLTGVQEPLEAFCSWQAFILEEQPIPLQGDEACEGVGE